MSGEWTVRSAQRCFGRRMSAPRRESKEGKPVVAGKGCFELSDR